MLICIPLASLLIDTGLPYFLSQAIGQLANADTDQLQNTLLITAGIGLAGVILNLVGFQSAVIHESYVRLHLVDDLLARLLAKDYSFFSNQKIGSLTGKFIDFVNAHMGLEDLFILRTLPFVLNISIGIIIIASNSPLLGLVVFGLLTLIIIQVKISLKLRRPLRQTRKRLIGELNGAIADSISNNLTVKTFANEIHESIQSHDLAEKYRLAHTKDFRWMSIEGSGRILLMIIIQIAAVGIMVNLIQDNAIDIAIAIFVVTYLQRVATQLFSLGEIINGYDKFFIQAAPMTEILAEETAILDAPNAPDLKVKTGEILFDHISYSYESKKSPAVIKDLTLHIQAGERIGLVGQSGAGKTTLTKLTLRFDDVTSGCILIDGQDISSVTQASLRQAIAYVPQEPLLFHRSLRENIMYGNLNATENQLRNAAKQAHALEFIDKLPQGFDTIVGERGVKLSGGQRQRIAIARAILKDAPILILDEATSALDSESESLIQDALTKLMKGRTSIVIAHRLSTVKQMDRIIVMDNGRIIEQGSHDELITKKGTYANLWSHQTGNMV